MEDDGEAWSMPGHALKLDDKRDDATSSTPPRSQTNDGVCVSAETRDGNFPSHGLVRLCHR
jgi:hypothetical protein